jgi:hypothetical protein
LHVNISIVRYGSIKGLCTVLVSFFSETSVLILIKPFIKISKNHPKKKKHKTKKKLKKKKKKMKKQTKKNYLGESTTGALWWEER